MNVKVCILLFRKLPYIVPMAVKRLGLYYLILRAYILPQNFCYNISPGIVLRTNCRYMLFRAGVPRHAIIKKFGGEAISGLEDLISVFSKLARGSRVPLEYISYMDRHRKKVLIFSYFPVRIVGRLPNLVLFK